MISNWTVYNIQWSYTGNHHTHNIISCNLISYLFHRPWFVTSSWAQFLKPVSNLSCLKVRPFLGIDEWNGCVQENKFSATYNNNMIVFCWILFCCSWAPTVILGFSGAGKINFAFITFIFCYFSSNMISRIV